MNDVFVRTMLPELESIHSAPPAAVALVLDLEARPPACKCQELLWHGAQEEQGTQRLSI